MKNKTCKIEGCERPVFAKGYCGMHYNRIRKNITDMRTGPLPWKNRPKKGVCLIDGCESMHYAKGYCQSHYRLYREYGMPILKQDMKFISICKFHNCNDTAAIKGFCKFHYSRFICNVSLSRGKGIRGKLNPRWNGGTSEYSNHYEMKKIRKIVLKEENYTCRYCGKFTKQIHHMDKTKDNHDRENLVACCHSCNIKLAGPKTTSKFLREHGITAKKLAEKWKISLPTVYNWERKNHPKFQELN